jgi:eukaryotic-like serine/threonine-protein kinase
MDKLVWQRAKQIFEEARALPADDRPDFIDRSCDGDEELREQVERLVGAYESDFLEDTVFGAAEVLGKPALNDGQTIGRYCIRELIGTGGMGQVFLADDTELDRPVAFKVLHNDVAEDK